MPTVNNGGRFFRGLVLQRLRRFRIEPRRGNTAVQVHRPFSLGLGLTSPDTTLECGWSPGNMSQLHWALSQARTT